MGHFAHLTGCASRDVAQRHEVWRLADPSEPQIEAKYRIPFLWLVGFGPDDALTVRRRHEDGHVETEDLLVLHAPASEVVARLKRRRESVLRLLDRVYGPFYDQWVHFIRSRYRNGLLLQTADLFSMEDYETSGVRMRAALRWLQPADEGQPIDEVAAIDWFCNVSTMFDERAHGQSPRDAASFWRDQLSSTAYREDGTLLWPPAPSQAEIDFAATVPEASAPAEPGSAQAQDDELTRMLREGVQSDGTMRGNALLAFDKAAGAVPAGADAPTRTLRKLISGSHELLGVVAGGLGGGVLFLLGLVMLWAVARPPWDWTSIGVAAGITFGGAWGLRLGWRAWRKLRVIARA